jgi:DNA invertase Pin-like site-specific DNA recombinase
MALINTGDTLAVPSLDRLSRSLKDLVGYVREKRRRVSISSCPLTLKSARRVPADLVGLD